MGSNDIGNPISPCPGPCDVAIPIVYPSQPIFIPANAVQEGVPFEIDVEASLHATFTVPGSSPPLSISEASTAGVRVLGLGHAGIAMINGRSGEVAYYEYGRYDPAQFGRVRTVPAIGAVTMQFGEDGNPTSDSFVQLMSALTRTNGGPYAFEAVYIKLSNGAFDVMKEFSNDRKTDVRERRAEAYDVAGNHCFTFATEVAESAGVNANVANATPLKIEIRGGNILTRNLVGWGAPDFEVPARQMRALQERYRPLNVSNSGVVDGEFSYPTGLNSR